MDDLENSQIGRVGYVNNRGQRTRVRLVDLAVLAAIGLAVFVVIWIISEIEP